MLGVHNNPQHACAEAENMIEAGTPYIKLYRPKLIDNRLIFIISEPMHACMQISIVMSILKYDRVRAIYVYGRPV